MITLTVWTKRANGKWAKFDTRVGHFEPIQEYMATLYATYYKVDFKCQIEWTA
jgi:hypothetical protein